MEFGGFDDFVVVGLDVEGEDCVGTGGLSVHHGLGHVARTDTLVQ